MIEPGRDPRDAVFETAHQSVLKEHGRPHVTALLYVLAGMVVAMAEEVMRLERLVSAGYVRRHKGGVAPPRERPPAIE